MDTCAVAGIIIIADKRKIREDREAKPRFEIFVRQSKKKVNYTGFTKMGIDFFIPVDYNNFADEEESRGSS